jgi:hypothetical protein
LGYQLVWTKDQCTQLNTARIYFPERRKLNQVKCTHALAFDVINVKGSVSDSVFKNNMLTVLVTRLCSASIMAALHWVASMLPESLLPVWCIAGH